MKSDLQAIAASGAALWLLLAAVPADAFSTMVSAQAQSCGGIENSSDGAVGQASAGAEASSSGMCGDGTSSSADAASSASVAQGGVSVTGDGTGIADFNGSFAQASFGERLTIENVPAALDTIDLRVVISFVGVPPAAAFYNSASMDAYVNPQVIFGEARLTGCSGDLCFGGAGPVRTETLDQILTLPRNGLGEFGFVDVFMDARFAMASTAASISGQVTVDVVGVPEAVIVSESGLFGSGGVDSDGDGVADSNDNCTLAANVAQRDSDGDGFGNLCDADLNNDCVVNAVDLGIMKSVFFGVDPDADLNGDGAVNATDLGLMKVQFFGAPGPSMVAVICTP